jgi:DNA-binding transcriptional LysR family regulator
MDGLTLHQLQCFDAVVTEGGFQAGADKLRRTHSTVFTSIKNLENQLGFRLLDRGGYRAVLTEAGRSFHAHTRVFLHELGVLRNHARQLAMGVESDLTIVIGDVCPLPQMLALLRRFFADHSATQFHLHFEAISGPWERLLDGDADLILHHIDESDSRLEFTPLFEDEIVPVVAPGLLAFPLTNAITPEQMRGYVQCVIRDTARHSPERSYYVIEGARSWTVSDQAMKKEIILRGMGWGHMPRFLIGEELRSGRLLSIAGKHLRGGKGTVVAARRRDVPHGPVAERLWRYFEEKASAFAASIGAPLSKRRSGSASARPRARSAANRGRARRK